MNCITCTECGKKFSGYRAFADHRNGDFKVSKPGAGRSCLNNDAMVERGYRFLDGVWIRYSERKPNGTLS